MLFTHHPGNCRCKTINSSGLAYLTHHLHVKMSLSLRSTFWWQPCIHNIPNADGAQSQPRHTPSRPPGSAPLNLEFNKIHRAPHKTVCRFRKFTWELIVYLGMWPPNRTAYSHQNHAIHLIIKHVLHSTLVNRGVVPGVFAKSIWSVRDWALVYQNGKSILMSPIYLLNLMANGPRNSTWSISKTVVSQTWFLCDNYASYRQELPTVG